MSECAALYAKNKTDDEKISGLAKELAEIDSGNPDITANIIGVSALGTQTDKERKEAVAAFEEQIFGNSRISPMPLSLSYNTLGCIYVRRGEYQKAVADFELAGKCIYIPKVETVLSRNRAAALVLKEIVADTPSLLRLMDVSDIIEELKDEHKPYARIGLARAYIRIGKLKQAGKVLDSFKAPSPEIDRMLTNIRMQLLRYRGMKGGMKGEKAFAELSILVEQILEQAIQERELASFYDLKSMLYFITGFYYAQDQTDKMKRVLEKARVMYPDDYSFLRNEAVLQYKAGDFNKSYDLLKRSYKQNTGQSNISSFIGKVRADISVSSLYVLTAYPFTHQRPLVHVRFTRNPQQLPPEINKITMGGIPLRSVVFGNYICAVPEKPLPEAFSDYTVSFRSVNPVSGLEKEHSVTTDQDLTLPVITVTSPAQGALVSSFSFKIHITVSDKDSGLDMSTLNVTVQPDTARGNRFVSYAVKNGVYNRVRRKRNTKVESSGVIEAIVPLSGPGPYTLSAEVADREHNVRKITDWKFRAE